MDAPSDPVIAVSGKSGEFAERHPVAMSVGEPCVDVGCADSFCSACIGGCSPGSFAIAAVQARPSNLDARVAQRGLQLRATQSGRLSEVFDASPGSVGVAEIGAEVVVRREREPCSPRRLASSNLGGSPDGERRGPSRDGFDGQVVIRRRRGACRTRQLVASFQALAVFG